MCRNIVFSIRSSRTNSSYLSKCSAQQIYICASEMVCWCVRAASMLLTIFLTRPNTVGPRRLSQMAVGLSCLDEKTTVFAISASLFHIPVYMPLAPVPSKSAARWCHACHLKTSHPSLLPAGEEHDSSIIIASAGVARAKPVDCDTIMC